MSKESFKERIFSSISVKITTPLHFKTLDAGQGEISILMEIQILDVFTLAHFYGLLLYNLIKM